MSEVQTTAPVVTPIENGFEIEWDIKFKNSTAWELIRVTRSDRGVLAISGRSEGPVSIPVENVGLIMSLIAELIPEAVAK